jgi:hypothetical protein
VGNLKASMLVIMIFLQVRILKVSMILFLQVRISKAQMRMMKNLPQVGILKVMMMIMAMVNTLSRVGNLKNTMLAMMIFLQVSIFKVPIKMMNIFLHVRIFKGLTRMMKNLPQVGIFKVVKIIIPFVDILSRVGNLNATMLMMMIFLQVRIFMILMNNFSLFGILK